MDEELYRQIEDLYINKNKTMQEIQDITGVNRKIVSKELKKHGIYSRYRISEEQLKIAIDLYKNGMSLTKISKEIGFDRHSLSTKLKENGIIENNRILTENQIQAIEEYKNGKDMLSICKKYNFQYDTFKKIIRETQTERHTITKYKYDYNIFKQIDTEEKAYWLGFLYADGYVNADKGIELTLQESDHSHLIKFRKFIGDESIPITYKESVKAYRICVNSKEIANDLINLGCVQAKSKILEFPTKEQVPEYLIHHFMRGYFDGDGCICKNSQLNFSVIGTPEFLNEYEKNILKAINRENPNKRQRRYDWEDRTENIQYGGNKQCLKIFQFLYKDATIYLQRKYDKFNFNAVSE